MCDWEREKSLGRVWRVRMDSLCVFSAEFELTRPFCINMLNQSSIYLLLIWMFCFCFNHLQSLISVLYETKNKKQKQNENNYQLWMMVRLRLFKKNRLILDLKIKFLRMFILFWLYLIWEKIEMRWLNRTIWNVFFVGMWLFES